MNSVFLSVVNSEFEEARKLRTFGLERAGYKVIAQPTFPHTTTDTVQKLSDLIESSDCVVHLVGSQLGSFPNRRCREEFLVSKEHSMSFLEAEPALRASVADCYGITYTQWEAFLAIHHKKPLLVYTNIDPKDHAHPQREHLDRLKLANKRADLFRETDLGDRVLADVQYLFRTLNPNFPTDITLPELATLATQPAEDNPKHLSPDSWF